MRTLFVVSLLISVTLASMLIAEKRDRMISQTAASSVNISDRVELASLINSPDVSSERRIAYLLADKNRDGYLTADELSTLPSIMGVEPNDENRVRRPTNANRTNDASLEQTNDCPLTPSLLEVQVCDQTLSAVCDQEIDSPFCDQTPSILTPCEQETNLSICEQLQVLPCL